MKGAVQYPDDLPKSDGEPPEDYSEAVLLVVRDGILIPVGVTGGLLQLEEIVTPVLQEPEGK